VIARVLGALALVASIGLVAPRAEPARPGEPVVVIAADPLVRLQDAVEMATQHHVPGASGSDWVLHGLERSDRGLGGREFIVATGAITTAGAPDTRVRLSGRYDPSTGRLERVSYQLQPATPTAPPEGSGWNVQRAVQAAFGEVLPDEPMHFALDSAQSSRVEGGGRRFEGSGIGTFREGDARFIAFTMTLSVRGELVEFDYSTASPADDAEQVAGF
jgi:hypothetical protein